MFLFHCLFEGIRNKIPKQVNHTPFMFQNESSSSQDRITLKCLSIGTPKTINFPFVPNGKLIGFRCLSKGAL